MTVSLTPQRIPATTATPLADVSVVICAFTEARWESLVAAVDSVRRQSRPPGEIIVVIDHNPVLLQRTRTALTGARVLESTEQRGLSGARNTGVAAAHGAYIAFLDDDATAAPDWLEQLARSVVAPDVLGVGGRVDPVWQRGRPSWFPPEFDWVVGCSYHGLPETASAIRNPLGCSMCLRREVFDAVGGFRTEVGRLGRRPVGDEETELCIRAHRRWPHGRFVYVPAAHVAHAVPADRARWAYFVARCFAEGRSKALVTRLVGARDSLSAERAYTLRALPCGVAHALADALWRHDLTGLARAGAVVAGLTITGAGYLSGLAVPLIARHRFVAVAPSSQPRDTVATMPAVALRRAGCTLSTSDPPASDPPVSPRTDRTGERLRVLLVTPRSFPDVGGVETHVHEVGRRLARQGVEVTILTTDRCGHLPKAECVEGMRIVRVRAWPAHRDYYFAPAMWRIITRGDWDVVHCQGVHTLVPPLAMLAAWRTGIPYVVTFHTGGHSSRVRSALRGLQWWLQRPLLAHAARLIGVSDFEAEAFRRRLHLPAEHVALIPNGADSALDVAPAAAIAPPELPHPLIVSIGRLERYKGHQRVLAALPAVRARYPSAHLLILGSGPYEQALWRLAQQLGCSEAVAITAFPASERGRLAATLAQADLVTLLSDYEAQGIAVLEALALHRPVLVAATSGLRELADRGWAQSVPLHSTPEQVAAAIIAQLQHPLVPEITALPTWDACAASLLALYENLARRPVCAF